MDARRTTAAVTGATVSLLEWAPADPTGPVVLLLHGGGADNAELSWAQAGAALADAGYRVIAPDHPGFGRSPRASWPLTQQNLIRYVGELVDALDLDDYVIGGLSLGGGLALGHLLDRPDAARGAMLLGSFGIMPRLTDGLLSRVNQLTTYALLRTGLLAALTRGYARNAGRDGARPAHDRPQPGSAYAGARPSRGRGGCVGRQPPDLRRVAARPGAVGQTPHRLHRPPAGDPDTDTPRPRRPGQRRTGRSCTSRCATTSRTRRC